jgi:glycolate oxidase FAD binding subunit
MPARDPAIARLTDHIQSARARGTALAIYGGGTKSFYGEPPRGEPLRLSELTGISSYEPSELVVSARAGTTLRELESVLAERGQCLPFDPPRFSPGGTVGGMVAAGISGPSRAALGSVRDYVLGVTLLNGRGELVTFGGQVMKNVAGYDVSRLMVGSWGVLGILCEVSLKVLAIRAAAATLEFDRDESDSLAELAGWRALPLPVHSTAWYQGRLRVRLAGARAAVRSACDKLAGTQLAPAEADAWWESVRDHTHTFFNPAEADLAAGECLWRLSVPAVAPVLDLSGPQFIEWGGAQRWLRTRAAAAEVRRTAARAGGHATLVHAKDKSPGAFARVGNPLMRIHRSLKEAFDPDRIFNPGRLYADL